MTKNLKDFSQNEKTEFKENYDKYEDEAKSILNKYKDMDNNTLMTELMSEVARQKQNGTFDRDKILKMLDSVSYLIPNNQIENIRKIIEQL